MPMISRRVLAGALALGGAAVAAVGCAKNSDEASTAGAQAPSSGAGASASPTGGPLQVTPAPEKTEGQALSLETVTVTLPAELTEITWYGDPHSRVKPHFYKGAGDCGLLDINVDHFRFESAQTSAFDEWEAYRRDGPTVTSTIVALDWPGAEGAWAWTWDQPADASILSDSATGTVNLSGVCMMLRSTSGQDVYIAAYAPRGGLQGCPALRALDSLTLG